MEQTAESKTHMLIKLLGKELDKKDWLTEPHAKGEKIGQA